jgi:hypothetical protein
MGNTSTTGYTLVKASTPFIDGNALWHIIVVSAAAGCGLAIAFGLILLGAEHGQSAKNGAEKAGGWLLGLLAAAFCIAAIGVGIYVMVHPAKSTPNTVVKSGDTTSLVTPRHHNPPHHPIV